MENPEEILHSLEEFSKIKPKDIPRELEEYLSYVARTGDPVYHWAAIKALFREKLINVVTEFYEACPSIEIPPCPNVDLFNYDIMKGFILEKLDTFAAAPFTIQRLSELLTAPRKEYTRIDKYMRALEKNILVVSTTEPGLKAAENGDSFINGLDEVEHIPESSNSSNDINVEEMDDTPSSWQETTPEEAPQSEKQLETPETLITESKIDETSLVLPEALPEVKIAEPEACTSTQEVVLEIPISEPEPCEAEQEDKVANIPEKIEITPLIEPVNEEILLNEQILTEEKVELLENVPVDEKIEETKSDPLTEDSKSADSTTALKLDTDNISVDVPILEIMTEDSCIEPTTSETSDISPVTETEILIEPLVNDEKIEEISSSNLDEVLPTSEDKNEGIEDLIEAEAKIPVEEEVVKCNEIEVTSLVKPEESGQGDTEVTESTQVEIKEATSTEMESDPVIEDISPPESESTAEVS